VLRRSTTAFIASFLFRRQRGKQVRPVASDDAAYFGVDLSDVVEALLNLLADHLELFPTERAAVQEFDWHLFAPPRRGVGQELNDAVGEASRNARAAGYTPNAIARIISTPSDVSMFSRLPEADQRAILRQADDKEFERYVTHAHMKIRAPMREERRSNQVDVTMPAVRRFPAPSSSASAPPPPSMPPCAAMIATSWCSALPSRRTPRRLAIDLEGGRVGEVKKGEMNQDPN
jgi:hypothetical protein